LRIAGIVDGYVGSTVVYDEGEVEERHNLDPQWDIQKNGVGK